MKAKVTVWLAVLLLGPALAWAQVGTLEGRVVDARTGATVPGVNMILDGTNYGTASGSDGTFSFTAPAGSYTLVATFIGYARYTAPVTLVAGRTLEVEVALTEGSINLDEIVVTALGIQREERSLGYSFQEVESDLVARAQESNLVNALAGKVAGVQVTSSSGQPGKASRIVIRGNSSLTGSNQPLFVIDGVPISNDEDFNADIVGAGGTSGNPVFSGGTINRAVDLDPSIIEDITILKGAAAMALYGSRAANGAIIITTKGGRGGVQQPLRVTYSSTLRWDDAVVEGYQSEFAQGQLGCFYNGLPRAFGGYIDAECMAAATGNDPSVYANANPQITRAWGPRIADLNQNQRVLNELGVSSIPTTDPRNDFYQTGGVIENSLSISGAALGGNYFLSGTYLDQEGIVPNTLMDRASILAKFGADLSPKFSVETSINYIRTENDWVGEGNGSRSFLFSLNFAPPTFDLTRVTTPDGNQLNYNTSGNNPIWLVNHNKFTSDVDRFIGSVRLAYDLVPGVTLSNQAGMDTYTDTRKGMVDIGTRSRPNGSLFDQGINRRELNNDVIVQGQRRLGPFGFSALVGNQVNYRYYNYNIIDGQVLGIPDFFNIDNASTVTGNQYTEERMLVGVYSQATFDYDDWAYLTLTGRNDWSSTLPADNNSYFYPSVNLGLVFTSALDVFNNTPLSFGKLRASWARIGNDAPVFSTSTVFTQATPGDGVRGNIEVPFNGINAYEKSNVLGNPDLKPELSSEYELGLDLRFFGQRARFDAAYYNRSTTNQIFQVPLPAATGFVQRLMNAGEVKNTGVELFLGLTPIQTRNFAWDLAANWSKNETEVVELFEGVESIFLAGFTNPQIRAMEGKNGYGVIWGDQFAYADRETHADLFAQFPNLQEGTLLIGADGLPIIANELGPVGNVQPDWLANLRSSVTYKGLTLSGLIDIREGGDILNLDLLYSAFYGTAEITADRGTEITYEGFNVDTGGANTTAVLRDQSYYQNFISNFAPNWVEDGSFVKLREVSLAYTIPTRLASQVGLQSATFTATGRNLWIDSDFSLGDPEGSLVGGGNGQGFYHSVTPGTRGYSLGVRLAF